MENKSAMSTEPSITDMNRVIQKFMGLPTERSVPKFSGGGNRMEATIHHYHTDYNWLHSAWDKLYRLFGMLKDEDYLKSSEYIKRMQVAFIYGIKAEAHKALYDAIVWYNSLNNKPI